MMEVASFAELHSALEECLLPSYWLFRGQSRTDWSLVPRCARTPYLHRDDKETFNLWKRRAIDVAENLPDDDWHWLALAQHHGFATRLLDWSKNPLVAAFFACCEHEDTDGAIFAYLGNSKIDELSFKQSSPWNVLNPVIFHPYVKNRRIANQFGSFTISANPDKCFSEQIRSDEKFVKIVISKQYKNRLLLELDRYGINWGTLFPDLDGNSKLFNWYVEYGAKYLLTQNS